MENIDIFLIMIVALFSFIGLIRGAIREAMSILAWILAVIVSAWDVPIIRGVVKKYVDVSIVADLTAGIIAFIIAFILINLIGVVASSFIKKTKLATIDRFFGLIVGALKGAFLLAFSELVLSSFGLRNDLSSYSSSSILIDKVYFCSDLIKKIIPDEFREFIDFEGETASINKKNEENEPKENKNRSKSSKDIIEELGKLEPEKIKEKSPDYSFDEKKKLNDIITSF